MTMRVRGGTISLTKLILAICTMGLSIPFIGVRRGPSLNLHGSPVDEQRTAVMQYQPQPQVIVVHDGERRIDWSAPANKQRLG